MPPPIQANFTFCHLATGGISRLWVTPFRIIRPLFQLGNYDLVKSIQQPLQWYEVEVDRSQDKFEETAGQQKQGLLYRQTLSLFLPKMQNGKRAAVNALLYNPHIAIVEDLNGQYHLLGEQFGLRFADYRAGSGTSSEANGYQVVLAADASRPILQVNANYIRMVILETEQAICPGVVLDNPALIYQVANCIVLQ